MKSKIRWTTAACCILLILSVLVCFRLEDDMEIQPVKHQAEGEPSEKRLPENDIVIDYYIWENEASYIEPVIEAYEALNAGVTVNLHAVDENTYDDNLENLLAGNEKVDLVGVRDSSYLVDLVQRGELMDLTSYISDGDWEVESYGNMFNEISISGRYFGIPTRSTYWVLLYNKDLFDRAGIGRPQQMTWEEYGELAIRLTGEDSNGETIYGGYWPPWCYNFAAIQSSGYLIDDDLEKTRQTLVMLNQFYNMDGSHVNYQDTVSRTKSLIGIFEEGNIAMMPQGEWVINMLLEKEKKDGYDVNWGIAPIPVTSRKDAGTTWGQYQFAGVAEDTRFPEETLDFLKFLCGEEAAKIFAQNGIIHAYSTDKIWEIYGETVGYDIAEVFYRAKSKQEQLMLPQYYRLLTIFNTCADDYLSGNCTIDEVMTAFEQQRKELYHNRNSNE